MSSSQYRCPHCGTVYQKESLSDMFTCSTCAASTKPYQEAIPSSLGGKLPPILISLTLCTTFLIALISLKYHVAIVGVILLLIYLCIEIIKNHNQNFKDRLDIWVFLQNSYNVLSQHNTAIQQELESYKIAYNQYVEVYNSFSPERRDQLALEIQSQQQTLQLFTDINGLITTKHEIEGKIIELKSTLIQFQEEELYQSFGFYEPQYDCSDSPAYKMLLQKVRDKQKEMVKDKDALKIDQNKIIDIDTKNIKKVVKDLEKLVLRDFNAECDSVIDDVSFQNLDSIRNKIKKGAEEINKLVESLGIYISPAFVNTKIEELQVAYEYQLKIKDEKEEQKLIKEQIKEDARVARELEDAREKIEKEKKHFTQIISEIQSRMATASEAEKSLYENKLNEYKEQLAIVEKDEEEIAYRESRTRAGYVYIISNIGSFGENIYKIGVTRRLDPQERVDELGSASVPFDFDVHAMIFSEDAPKLEYALHDHFAERAVNKMNVRKEFFRVNLEEIEQVVKENHNSVVEFTKLAKAEDYRLTLAKERTQNTV